MNCFEKIFGNEEQIKMFSSLIESGTFSHAYMLTGPKGSGKKTFALAVAAAIAKKRNGSDAARRILSGFSPDVMTISRPEDKKTTGVDNVRDFISTVALSPSELDFKFYIFDEADTLTPQAQNSLLKVIEEPPADVYIFLLCENQASLLQTVRSRVQSVAMQRFLPEDIKKYFGGAEKANVSEEIFDFAARLCGGAIGKARELLSGGNEYEMYDSCKKIISLQAGKINGAKYFAFINVIAENSDTREKISMMLDYLFAAYVDILKAKSCDEPLLSFFDGASALDFSEKFASGALEASLDAVSKIRNGLVFNTNISISSANLAKLLWAAV